MKPHFLTKLLGRRFQDRKVREKINLGNGAPSNIVIKLAETREELEQAFQVLHDAYVDESWMDPQPSGLRMTKYHALPMTAVLVAIDLNKNVVVGTISVIRDSELGLPLDAVFPLDSARSKYAKIAEISSLAVHKDYRKDSSQVFWPLVRSVIRYARDVMQIDAHVIGVHPTRHHLYTSILGFKKLRNTSTKDYGFVKNAPVAAYIANLEEQESWCEKTYSKLPDNKNWFKYCYQTDLPVQQYQFFEPRYYPVQKAVMNADLFKYFFQVRTGFVQTLAENEKSHVVQQLGNDPKVHGRKTQRYHTRIFGKIYLEKSKVQSIDVSILNFSGQGVGIHCLVKLPKTFYIRAYLGSKDDTWLKVEVKYEKNGFYGCKILSHDETWVEFVKAISATHYEKGQDA